MQRFSQINRLSCDLRLETQCCQLEVSSGPNWQPVQAAVQLHSTLLSSSYSTYDPCRTVLDTLEPVEVFSRHAMKHCVTIVQTRANDSTSQGIYCLVHDKIGAADENVAVLAGQCSCIRSRKRHREMTQNLQKSQCRISKIVVQNSPGSKHMLPTNTMDLYNKNSKFVIRNICPKEIK